MYELKSGEVEAHTARVAAGLAKAARDNLDVMIASAVCFHSRGKPGIQIAAGPVEAGRAIRSAGPISRRPGRSQLGSAIEAFAARPRVESRGADGKAIEGFTEGQPINYPGDLALEAVSQCRRTSPATRLARPSARAGLDLEAGQNIFALLKRKDKEPFLQRAARLPARNQEQQEHPRSDRSRKLARHAFWKITTASPTV